MAWAEDWEGEISFSQEKGLFYLWLPWEGNLLKILRECDKAPEDKDVSFLWEEMASVLVSVLTWSQSRWSTLPHRLSVRSFLGAYSKFM